MKEKAPERTPAPIDTCPYCGGNTFAEAKQRFISPVDDGMHGSVLYHTVCIGCGSVVRSFIKDIAPFVNE